MTEFGGRHAAFLPQLPRTRLVVAALIVGLAFAGAAVLHSHPFETLLCDRICSRPETRPLTPGWVDPTALGLCLLGVAGAIGALTGRARVATAAVILGASLGGAAVVYSHYSAIGRCQWSTTVPSTCTINAMFGRAEWVTLTAIGIVAFGVALAAGVLLTARRGRLAG